MKRGLVLQHQNDMVFSKEFFLLEVPKESIVLFYAIVMVVLVVFGVIIFGKIDDVVKIGGIVRTQENVSCVNNVIGGKVMELNYKPGSHVKKGDFLYRLDPSVYNAQHDNLVSENENLATRLKGTKMLISSYRQGKNLVNEENFVAYTKFESFLQTKEELRIQKEIAYQNYQEEKIKPASLKNERTIKQRKLEYEYSESVLKVYEANFIQSLYAEEDELQLLYDKNGQEILKLDSQYDFLSVYAPVDGFVQEISLLNIGDYVEAGKNILNIIPDDSAHFRVEMHIPSKDMGKIKEGMKVKYRLSAFPYFEYQGAAGVITAIDPDIRMMNGSMYYCVYADIDRVQFSNRHGDVFPIRAGLETTARIILENNTILFLILKKMDFLY